MAGTCSERGCARGAVARGLCQRCYDRIRRGGGELPPLGAPMQAAPDEARFWSKVDRSGPHWLWVAGKTPLGYGYVWWEGRMQPAHRIAWRLLVGPIPGRMTIDHLRDICGNTSCVKALADEAGPAHLEVVTQKVNIRRGDAPQGLNFRKTHCVNGHEFTPDNTRVRKRTHGLHRECLICVRAANAIRVARWRARQRALAAQ